MSLINRENDYSKTMVNAPKYKTVRILPNTGGGSLTLTQSSSSMLTFEIISNQSINFAGSYFSWDFAQTTLGGGNAIAAYCDIPPINRMSLRSRSGAVLADINNFQLYWKECVLSGLNMTEYASRSTPGVAIAIATSRLQGSNNFCNPGNEKAATAPSAAVSNCTLIDQTGAIDSAKVNLPAYKAIMHYGTSAQNAAMYMQCELNLNDLINTIFCCNKDLYLKDGLLLDVEFCGYDSYSFLHTTVADLTASATSGVAPSLSNIQLNVAVQQNQALVDTVRAQVESVGLSVLFPYVSTTSLGLGTSTSGNAVQKISRAYGLRLLRIYSAEYVTSNTLNLRANFYNFGGTTTQYSTVLDGNKMQYSDMLVTSAEDCKAMSHLLKNTLCQNLQVFYSHCPVWVDEFSGLENLPDARERDFNVVSGLPLDREYTWNRQIISKTAVDTSTSIVIVGQKELMLSPKGIEILG